VTVAQAFHWFDTPLAAAEIRRVLRPEGRLGVIWNSWDERVPWVARVQALVHPHVGDARQQRSSDWQSALAASGLFGELHEETFSHVVEGDLETLGARVSSVSYISALPDRERAQVLEAVRGVVAQDRATAGRERFEMPYTTQIVWARRR
jgi:SAM-dependent methyltransferase